MENTQTIQDKQLAAEVYAQRLAYISVTGKEPNALDKITQSGYLSCWNEAIAAVGDPFTDSGKVLLSKLQQKSMFHGQKHLYHKGFSSFFFRILYLNFIDNLPLSRLPNWKELDFNNSVFTTKSVFTWLDMSIRAQMTTEEDFDFMKSIIENHNQASQPLIKSCLKWIKNTKNIRETKPKSYRLMDAILIKNIHYYVNYTEKFFEGFERRQATLEALPQYIKYKQAEAQLLLERETYKKLFFVDPGTWSIDNYLKGVSRSLQEPNRYSDLFAVKIEEEFPEEFGWGVFYNKTINKVGIDYTEFEGLGAETLTYDIIDVSSQIVHDYIYHYAFLPLLLNTLGVDADDIELCWQGDTIAWLSESYNGPPALRAGTPGRLSHTTHWLGLTYHNLTQKDWLYLLSLLNPLLDIQVEVKETIRNEKGHYSHQIIHTGKFRDKYPTVQRAAEYARFKTATMPTSGLPLMLSPSATEQIPTLTQEVLPVESSAPQPVTLGLTWQRPRTEFVELVCALYEAGAITIDGPGGRDAIVERLGSALGVKGTTPVSTVLQDIKNKRNGDRQTPLLDQLKTKFLDYLGK